MRLIPHNRIRTLVHGWRRPIIRSGVLLFLLVGLLFTPHPGMAQTATSCAADVVVQPGDSLSSIAGRIYGDPAAFTDIVAATNARADIDPGYATIQDPNVLEVGWKLCIPALPAERAAPEPQTDMNAWIAAVAADIYGTFEPDQIRELQIERMRQRSYHSSNIVIEETLTSGSTYNRYIVSYQAEGLTLYALMAVPTGPRPPSGWPVILFNHGYAPPDYYYPTSRYAPFVDALARNGYVAFLPDYRGHGRSEGEARGYAGPDYTVDVLSALAALKNHAEVDPNRIGMWGHSLGGAIALRTMVVGSDVKAGVIWSGMVVSYADLLALLDLSPIPLPQAVLQYRQQLYAEFGTPTQNPAFWESIAPNAYLADLSGPIQLHHGEADTVVPPAFSMILHRELQAAGQPVELFIYASDDHNITANFGLAVARTIDFFDRYVKVAEIAVSQSSP